MREDHRLEPVEIQDAVVDKQCERTLLYTGSYPAGDVDSGDQCRDLLEWPVDVKLAIGHKRPGILSVAAVGRR